MQFTEEQKNIMTQFLVDINNTVKDESYEVVAFTNIDIMVTLSSFVFKQYFEASHHDTIMALFMSAVASILDKTRRESMN